MLICPGVDNNDSAGDTVISRDVTPVSTTAPEPFTTADVTDVTPKSPVMGTLAPDVAWMRISVEAGWLLDS